MISTVSIPGVDDSVSPADLADISQMYPFVEWGINLNSSVGQMPTYPSEEWIEELLSLSDKVRLRGILHGRWQNDILSGNLSIKEERPLLWKALQRIQIDIRKGHFNIIDALQLIPDKEIILSTENTNSIITGMKLNAHPLFPRDKLFSYTGYCGYTLMEWDIDLLLGHSENNLWVSVEGFRGDDGITMDLLKVERFLDLAEDKVTHDSWFRAMLQTGEIKKRFSQNPGSHEMESSKIKYSW